MIFVCLVEKQPYHEIYELSPCQLWPVIIRLADQKPLVGHTSFM